MTSSTVTRTQVTKTQKDILTVVYEGLTENLNDIDKTGLVYSTTHALRQRVNLEHLFFSPIQALEIQPASSKPWENGGRTVDYCEYKWQKQVKPLLGACSLGSFGL